MTKRASIILLAAFTLLIGLATVTRAEDVNHAAVVVSLGDGEVAARCVAFSEPDISGLELLQRSGLHVIVEDQSTGSAVCSIDGTGCAADDCFCECRGGGQCTYWSYWHRQGDAWNYSAAGSGIYRISDGMVDGWSWGPGSVVEAIPPPSLSFADVCMADEDPTPTFTPSATLAAIVIPTVAPPTETPAGNSPTPTVRPTETLAPATDAAQSIASPTVPAPESSPGISPTSPPPAIATAVPEVVISPQPESPTLTATAEFAVVAPVAIGTPDAEPVVPESVPPLADAAGPPDMVEVTPVDQSADGDRAVTETLNVGTDIAVIGAGAAPELERASMETLSSAETQTPPQTNWRSYATLLAMLLALGALVAVAKLRVDKGSPQTWE